MDFSTKAVHLVRREDGTTNASCRRLILTSASQMAEKDAVVAREVATLMPPDEWWEGVWLAGVEYPYTDAKRLASIVLKTVLGAILASIPPSVHVIALPARVWTPQFLRESPDDPLPKVPRASADRKPLIKARALALLGIEDTFDQDTYDAFGISWAVEAINAPAVAA